MNTEKCKSVVERDKIALAPCQHLSYYPLVVDKVHGAIVTDIDGNEYIDFLSSASSLNLGGHHPVVTSAIKEQLDKVSQYAVAYTYSDITVSYAERLVSVFPGEGPAKILFSNCGSDANEGCIKYARAYTGRQKIIVFNNSYHGSTYGSSTMTTCSPRMHENIGPLLPEIYAFPFYGTDIDDETAEKESVAAIELAFSTWMPANEVAAVVIEPIQGDGGILPAHPIFMKKLYELCKKNGILFFSDEVQQGFYRTGKFFGIEHYDVVPDGVIMGKSIGGGLTLGAFMARAEIMECLPAPAHTFTLGGNAIACAAGIASFDVLTSGEFQTELKEHTECIEAEASALMEKHPDVVHFVRNVGMSMGIGICHMQLDGSKVEDDDATYKILYRAYEKGLLIISLAGHVLRVQPPLVITCEQIKKAFTILDESIQDLKAGLISDDVFKYRAGW